MIDEPIFTSAPLPFQGQKRNFVKQFRTALDELIADGRITTIVDLFGGSGLLAHTAKRHLPGCRVIYNDHDNYRQRLENVPRTNVILTELREVLKDYPRGERLTLPLHDKVLEILKRWDSAGHVDYISLSASLLFSQKYALSFDQMSKESFYNRIRKDGYHVAGYLDGLEVVRCDYFELFKQFCCRQDVLFLVDPPYLSTDTTTYNSDSYWRLKDYLDVLLVLAKDNYVYFTSNKSQVIELCDWFAENYGLDTPFSNATVVMHQVKSYACKFTDMMYYKKYEQRE